VKLESTNPEQMPKPSAKPSRPEGHLDILLEKLKSRPALQSFDSIQKKKETTASRRFPRPGQAPQLPTPSVTERKSSFANIADSAWAMLDSLEFGDLDLSLENK
jgi:hypothetical protein